MRINPKVVVQQLVQPFSIFNVSMPNDLSPWNDGRVRRAVSLAVNREEMNDLVYAGGGYAYTNGIPWFALFDTYPEKEATGRGSSTTLTRLASFCAKRE